MSDLDALRAKAEKAKAAFIAKYGREAYEGVRGRVGRADARGVTDVSWRQATSTRVAEQGSEVPVTIERVQGPPRRKRTIEERMDSMMQRLIAEASKSRMAGGGMALPDQVLEPIAELYRSRGAKDLTTDDLRTIAGWYLHDAEKRLGKTLAPNIKP